jgi:hypothetical protein
LLLGWQDYYPLLHKVQPDFRRGSLYTPALFWLLSFSEFPRRHQSGNLVSENYLYRKLKTACLGTVSVDLEMSCSAVLGHPRGSGGAWMLGTLC